MNYERLNNICFTYTWIIENYSYSWQKMGECISSPAFIVDTMWKTKWRLQLYPKGFDEIKKDFISIFLILEDSNTPESVIINYQTSILATDGSVLASNRVSTGYFSLRHCLGCPEFMERDEILQNRIDDYLSKNALTVRCTMWKIAEKHEEIGRCWARTRIGVEQKSFVWNIERFNSFQESIYKITSARAKKSIITLKLFPSSGLNNETFIRVEVCARDYGLKPSTFRMYLVDISRKRIECLNGKIPFGEGTKTALFTLPWPKEELMKNKNRYLPNDVLQLYCECDIVTGIALKDIEKIIYGSLPSIQDDNLTSDGFKFKKIRLDSKDVLKENLETLYKENLLCDTKLKTKSGSFPAHKNILSARSPVFKAMFSNDMKEKNSECVDIEDLDDDTVQRMLLYMYTATLPDLLWDSACKLYAAADKYEILSLKSDCISFLNDNLSPGNSCYLLLLADRHQDKDLKSAVHNYILSHRDIFNTSEWKCFMETNAQLAAELLFLTVKT